MGIQSRRDFLKKSMIATGGICLSGFNVFSKNSDYLTSPNSKKTTNTNSGKIIISNTKLEFEREPLLKPFGFKGGYLSELWQSASYIKSHSGLHAIGLGTQSVLWSDEKIFTSFSESGGNAIMYALTERALQLIKGQSFNSPIDLLDELLPELYKYGQTISSNPDLRKTFILNSLVSVDNALWLLYAKENNISNFDDLIPLDYKSTFAEKHKKIAAIPLISFNVTPETINKEVVDGRFFMKIKIGQPGSQNEMLQKDMKRLLEVHTILKDVRTPYTESGKLPYYFDANGRYESKEMFMRFLDYAEKIDAFDQIAMIEEPFPEHEAFDVTDIPVRLAADESVHTVTDTIQRIEMGYRAIALKPIAKTLSMTMKIAKAATERNIPCFCADLTVNPILVEWNKNIAARLKSFPGIGNIGLLESNGHQNYVNWEIMKNYYPSKNKPWIEARNGFYHTNNEYFNSGGGIFDQVEHYENIFEK